MKITCKYLYATAGTLEQISQSISKFYGGSPITLTETKPKKEWSISTGKGKCKEVRVIYKARRYRFEQTEAA